jgi:hypothetical protein
LREKIELAAVDVIRRAPRARHLYLFAHAGVHRPNLQTVLQQRMTARRSTRTMKWTERQNAGNAGNGGNASQKIQEKAES